MNIMQKQADFGRTLFEINQNAMQEMIRTQQENIQKYFAMNTAFGQRLPEIRDVATLWKCSVNTVRRCGPTSKSLPSHKLASSSQQLKKLAKLSAKYLPLTLSNSASGPGKQQVKVS